MLTGHGNKKNGKRVGKDSSTLEWQISDSDAEWQTLQQGTLTTLELPKEALPRPSWVMRHWHIGVALFLLFAIIGGWTWSIAQRGIDQIEDEIRDQVEVDLWAPSTQGDGLGPASEQGIRRLFTTIQDDTTRPLTSTVQLLAFPGETAIVQLVMQPGDGQPALRQTRFYRQTAEGWQLTKPDNELWGAPHSLESSHFIFHFRQNDAKAVIAVARQMDAVYTEIEHNFALTPNSQKLVIDVSVESIVGAILTLSWEDGPLVIPSPAVYLAPMELSDSTILAQSITLPLIESMAERAVEDHDIPDRWHPLLRGLRLWQLWNLDMPLAQWQQELVKWLYFDKPPADVGQKPMLPARYKELCALYRLWMLLPELGGIPLSCTDRDSLVWPPRRWATHVPRTRLGQLSVPLAMWENEYRVAETDPYHPSEPIVIANLIEYMVSVYGHEQLPVLLAGLAQFDEWETLVPAVFGVSVTDFEAGWQSYMAQQYNVELE